MNIIAAISAAVVAIIGALAPTLPIILKILGEARERKAVTKRDHEEMMKELKKLTSMQEENAQLRADCEAKDKRIVSLENKNERLTVALAQREPDKKKKD